MLVRIEWESAVVLAGWVGPSSSFVTGAQGMAWMMT